MDSGCTLVRNKPTQDRGVGGAFDGRARGPAVVRGLAHERSDARGMAGEEHQLGVGASVSMRVGMSASVVSTAPLS